MAFVVPMIKSLTINGRALMVASGGYFFPLVALLNEEIIFN